MIIPTDFECCMLSHGPSVCSKGNGEVRDHTSCETVQDADRKKHATTTESMIIHFGVLPLIQLHLHIREHSSTDVLQVSHTWKSCDIVIALHLSWCVLTERGFSCVPQSRNRYAPILISPAVYTAFEFLSSLIFTLHLCIYVCSLWLLRELAYPAHYIDVVITLLSQLF